MPKVYSVEDVAAALHITIRTVYEYIYQKKLRAAKIGNKWAIKAEWVDEFIDASEVKEESA